MENMTAVLCLLVLLAQDPPDPVQAAVAALDASKPSEAIALLEPLVEKDPKNLPALFHLGLAYALANQDEKSIGAYRRTLELDPSLYEAKVNLAQVLLRQKRGAEAKDLLESALQQKPGEKRLVMWLAEALLAAGDAQGAEAQARKVLAEEPANQTAWELCARALQAQGKDEEAAQAFEKAGEAGAAAAVREAAAVRMLNAGKPAEAAALLERVVSAAPTTAARYALAIAYLRGKQVDKSLALAAQIVQAEPANFDLRMFYGRLLRDQKNYAEAARQFNEAVKLNPNAVEGWSELTGMLIMLEMYDPALQGLEKVRSLQGETPGYWWFRATVLDATKQPKPALEAYQKFLAASQGKSPDEEFKARQRVRILQKVVSK